MLPQHSQKSFWLYKFSSKNISVWSQKNICGAPFLDARELHSWSNLKANVCIFLYISVRKSLFQRRSEICLMGEGAGELGVWGRLNNFIKGAPCLGLATCFTIFHFNLNFLKFNYFFSILILPSIALKRWNFTDNLDFKGKIVAKFTKVTFSQYKIIWQKCHLHNGIFHHIQLYRKILLYHFPCVIP